LFSYGHFSNIKSLMNAHEPVLQLQQLANILQFCTHSF
jgi:hypothetical protein